MSVPSSLCADLTLTINNLRLVTASLENWDGLGHYDSGLGVPAGVCNKINTSYKSEDERKKALLRYYLDHVPMASWPSVAGALYFIKDKAALQAVKNFLQHTPGGQ